jgi:hypothetical protein
LPATLFAADSGTAVTPHNAAAHAIMIPKRFISSPFPVMGFDFQLWVLISS